MECVHVPLSVQFNNYMLKFSLFKNYLDEQKQI